MDIGLGFLFFPFFLDGHFSRCSRVEGRQCHETRCLYLFAPSSFSSQYSNSDL